ncbi:hypothetical protein [Acinetobacter rudis]|uniref:hypothetical protein n=1 Tax=Acinetobacter rudis TaxID=632955 RepID=UPI00333F1626
MKLLCFLLMLFSANALADDGFCRTIYDHAEITMSQRQKGVSLTFQLETIDGLGWTEKEKPFKNMLYTMVEEAYGSSKFSTLEMKKEASQEFAAKWYLRCLKANKK